MSAHSQPDGPESPGPRPESAGPGCERLAPLGVPTTSAEATAPDPVHRRGLLGLLWAIVGVVYVLDQVSKVLAVEHLSGREPVPLLGDLLHLRLLYNPGAALSLGTGMTWVLTLVATAVTVVVLRTARRLGSRSWAVALGLLLGGALGNLTDRFLREPGLARGHVVDFIGYADWFVGNVADIAIVAAAVLIAVLALRGVDVDGSRTRPDHEG